MCDFIFCLLMGNWWSAESKIQPSLYIKALHVVSWVIDCLPFSQMRSKATVEQVKRLATEQTGLSCFGDDKLWERALQTYFDDIWDNPQYHRISRLSCRVEATKILCRRLKIFHKLQQCPEIASVPIPNAIFIVGMPRTGSTFLHQRLSISSSVM